MPLTRKQRLDEDSWLAIWKMDEPLDCLPQPRQVDLSQYKAQLTHNDGLVINHDSDGAPQVEGFHVSISHTKGWAAMILSRHHRNGIDMEYVSYRVNKILPRFMRNDETQDTLYGILITWCAKEAAYKYYHEQHLGLLEMRLPPFTLRDTGVACLENLRQGERVTVNYEANDDFVLTYITG